MPCPRTAFLMACFMGVWSSEARRGLRRPLRGSIRALLAAMHSLSPLLTSTLPPTLNFAEAHLPPSPGGHRGGGNGRVKHRATMFQPLWSLAIIPQLHHPQDQLQVLGFGSICCSTWPFPPRSLITHFTFAVILIFFKFVCQDTEHSMYVS